MKALLPFLLLCLCAGFSSAEERIQTWGEVVSVRPIEKRIIDPPTPGCRTSPPAADEGLAPLIAWDLDNPCRTRQSRRVVAFEVTYRWNERTYTARRKALPKGDRIPLKLSLEVVARR